MALQQSNDNNLNELTSDNNFLELFNSIIPSDPFDDFGRFMYKDEKYQSLWYGYDLVELFDVPIKWTGDNSIDENFRDSHDAYKLQQELDLRTGFAFTRLQTIHMRENCNGDEIRRSAPFSYGSCIFPTLGFVAERYQERENFEPKIIWNVKLNHKVDHLNTEFTWTGNHLYELDEAEAVVEICKQGNSAVVENVKSKPKIRLRPLPLNTAELTTNICRLFKIEATEVMKIAKRLHNKKFISNPRTEANIFPEDLDLKGILNQQLGDDEWGKFAKRILEDGGPDPRKGDRVDQKGHPPIYPTIYRKNYKATLTDKEQVVYEFIVRHFLASLGKDAVGEETEVEAVFAGQKFVAKGLTITETNHLDVYIYRVWKSKEIHRYEVGSSFTSSEIFRIKSETSPPKLLTEADLIELMVENHIGTDSTYDIHIEKVKSQKHDYVKMDQCGFLKPTPLGLGLVEGYNKMPFEPSLTKPDLRADFERERNLVKNGQKKLDVVLAEQIARYRKIFEVVKKNIHLVSSSVNERLNQQESGTRRPREQGPDDCPQEEKCPRTEGRTSP